MDNVEALDIQASLYAYLALTVAHKALIILRVYSPVDINVQSTTKIQFSILF